MSLFDDERYTWRETYFVLFDPPRRPRLRDLRRELLSRSWPIEILEQKATPDGKLESLTVASYEDHAALEIAYREGDAVALEIDALARTLQKGCSLREKERIDRTRRYRAKFDVLHFEQTAGTQAFKAVKRPELKFAPPFRPSAQRPRFHFDANSYENCVDNGAGAELDADARDPAEDSSVFERIDPNTLVFVLEILCRTSGGVAVDPAGGIVI